MTRVAVLMPYYHHPVGLRRSLNSLRGEAESFSLYVVDDGNVPPLQINPGDYPFTIHVLRLEKNSGIVAALNFGLEKILADGFDFIARLDAGDDWIPGRLTAQRDFLLAKPNYVWVGSWATAVGAGGKDLFTLKYPENDAGIRKYVRINSPCCHPAVMLRASAVRAAGNYSDNYPAAEDYEFFWRLLNFGQAANLPYPWLRYELNAAAPSISTQRRERQLQSRLKLQIEKFDPATPLAWWGILRTMILLLVPYGFLRNIKSWLWRA
jgi:glycosyltransferase involved in cell wall biosynthesis